jgi:Mg-chelatase subunit ChlD
MSRALHPKDDPVAAIEELAEVKAPWLFGVRHHSPACSIALPALLAKLKPTAIAIEMPADLAPWIEWLGHPDAEAPLAVAAVSEGGDDLGFYPFADFSPELVAIRWARAAEIPVHAIDLPAARRPPRDRNGEPLGIAARLRGADDDSWEHMVEAAGVAAEPERVRRAALLYGWALRIDEARGDGVSALDLAREEHMRDVLATLTSKKSARIACVVGSFHAAALLPKPTLWSPPPASEMRVREGMVSSLIPYAFELLDSRSGYPAGIRDPMWQQRLWATQKAPDAAGIAADVAALVSACLVEITREVRHRGLPASVPDARAAAEVAISLAQLRGLPAPGRRELVEAVQTALSHGELLGRGRIVAKAMQTVLVGHSRGRLAPDTPRSGLGPHVASLMEELRLPMGAMPEAIDLRLDPLRSPLDRRRHVALARLRACGIPYGTELESVAAGGLESLTSSWRVKLTPATEAMIELAGLRGVTLKQASAGSLRAERARMDANDKLTAVSLVALAESAAEAGATELVNEILAELTGPRLSESTLSELIALIALIDRILAGHIVALPADADDAVPGEIDQFPPPPIDRDAMLNTAVASVLGLAGSESLDDAKALSELVRVLDRPEHATLGDSRLRWSIDQLVDTGTPIIVGAASVIQVLIHTTTPEILSTSIGAWLDGAVDLETRRILANKLRGALAIAAPLFEGSPVFLAGLIDRVEQLPDGEFLVRVPALREGFETLSNASRRRLLRVLGDRLGSDARGQGLDVATSIAPEVMLAAAEADRAGRDAIARVPRPELVAPFVARAPATTAQRESPEHEIPIRDRWRMILGHERDRMKPRSARAMRALDELYGSGHGEGSRGGDGGGQESSFPTVRAWRDEIEALFGARVFEEVAGQAAAQGRVAALLELDPENVTPSVELLEQVLSLKGGLGEGQLGKLRALIRRVVDDLVRELAVRVRPALQGSTSPRATRRPSSVLHLARTVSANLAKVQEIDDEMRVVPERLYFKQKSRRHMDWNIVLVVDVSGSMEPSVIYSAMMAAILSGVPWISVKFIAFSTEIVDLSDHAHDPLALLLEVNVGGGTHIAKALRYARTLAANPRRTIVITVSDFEEGYSVDGLLGEVRSLVEAGVTCLGLAALDDRGAPRYAVPIAEQVAAAGMPIAALTPLELARWVGDKIR